MLLQDCWTIKLFATRMEITELGTRSFFPGSLSAQFLPMDCYRSTAHFEDFQVRSSLNRSQTDQCSLLEKSGKNSIISYSFDICILNFLQF